VKVGEIMKTEFVYATVPGTRETVLQLMAEHQVNAIPLLKKGTDELAGMITRADLMRKPEEEQLALLMCPDPPVASPSDEVEDVVRIFLEQQVRRIPVVEGRKLKGILTVHQVIRKAVSTLYADEPITPFVQRHFTCVWEKTPLRAAYAIMRLAGADLMPVLSEKGDLVGVISVSDFINLSEIVRERRATAITAASEGADWSWDATSILYITTNELKLPDKLVGDVMVREVITTFEHATIGEAVKSMRKHDINQLPVTNAKGELCGILRDVDLLRVLIRGK